MVRQTSTPRPTKHMKLPTGTLINIDVIEPDERNFVDETSTVVVKAQSTLAYNKSMVKEGKAMVPYNDRDLEPR